jgi:hypothetical protein
VRVLLVDVSVVYGRLYKGKECVEYCVIFRFRCPPIFLVVLTMFLLKYFWYSFKDVVCRS